MDIDLDIQCDHNFIMKEKVCTKCKIEQPLSNFRKRGVRPGVQPYCIPCQQAYDREYWLKTRDKRLKHRYLNDKKIRVRNAKAVFDYLITHPCVDCGENDPIVLEFDHIGKKEESISILIGRRASLAKLYKEINKCEVRCANCHRRKTAKERKWHKDIT